MLRYILLLAILGVFLTGCSTVNRGATDYFRIDTVPQGAKAITSIETHESKRARKKNSDLEPSYKSCDPTPCAIALPRRSEFIVTLEHDGYEPVELFITNSGSSASYSASAVNNVATTAGTVAVTAPVAAGLATATSQLAAATLSATTAATVNIGTIGLVPLETALSASSSLFTATPTTTGSVVSSAIPPALAVTGAMILTDMATGANLNLYPNPVVIGLPPKGALTKIDPNVEGFKTLLSAREKVDILCTDKRRNVLAERDDSETCSEARKQLSAIIKDRRKRQAEAKKAIKEARQIERERLRKEKPPAKPKALK
jgi:hypothetical protein